MSSRLNLIVFVFAFGFAFKTAAGDYFDAIRTEVLKGGREKSIAMLTENLAKNQVKTEDMSLAQYVLGTLLFQNGSFDESAKHFQESLKLGSKLADYINLHLGRIYKTLGKYDEAHQHLRQIRTAWGSKKNFEEARFELGLLGVLEKDWHQARMHFEYLSRKMRGTEHYPQVLWHLVLVENKLRRPWQSCRWARKLYSKYPTHPLVKEWNIDLATAKVAGETLGCYATIHDVKARIKSLGWAGETDRARAEIDSLKAKNAGKGDDYYADNIFSEFLVDEGMVEEAMPIILKYYGEKRNNIDYLQLLGKAAARAQRYQISSAAYMRAYDLSPNTKTGRASLFKAAFVSYQSQDYDGAIRKFELVTQKFRKSGLVRDAKWHLAWIRYLKGDYDGAYKAFANYKSNTRKPRRHQLAANDKVNYWMGMSSLRSGRNQLAKQHFEILARGNGYYSILARTRLEEVPKTPEDVRLPAQTEAPEVDPANAIANSEAEDEQQKDSVTEEDESEETVNKDEEEDEETEGEVAQGTDVEEEAKDMMVSMSFGNPDFMRKYQRAQDLIRVGLFDLAKWELFDIEGRIRDPKKLRMLISQYQMIESYNRSSYVGYVVLGNERTKKGIEGAKDLWEASYPLAYQSTVKTVASDYSVPTNFVWSIIRAESQFKADAKSPTGALGLMQIMPNTAKQVARLLKEANFHTDQLSEPGMNIKIGTRYLGKLLKKYSGQLPLVAAAYNAGPHRIDGWLMTFGSLDTDEFVEHIPFFETREYVKKVVGNYYNYDHIYSGKETNMAWLTAPVGVKGNTLSAFREIWD
ncbi:MAG: hypothetical protein A4S09_02775 [Proteobacteria bacterium SG_bin7]|nr:MAG: hypothetical protein A4S09_02775 [Proteobacteria bacterium SG_bin7]